MSCIVTPAATFTEEQEQKALIRGATPRTFPPQEAVQLAVPLLCLPTLTRSGWTDSGEGGGGGSDLSLSFTLTDTSGAPQVGDPITIGGTTINTNSQGVAGPFIITNNYQPVALTLTVTNTAGAVQVGLNVTLGGVTKTTDSSGQVTFNISGTGVVS